MWGTRRNLVALCLYIPWRRYFTSDRDSVFSLRTKKLRNLIRLIENFNLDNLYINPRCHILVKVLSISENTAAVDMSLLKFKVTGSISLIHWSVVLWWSLKSNWLALSRLLSSRCLWTVFGITFSNSLPVVEKRLIGRKFWGKFGSLPDFGNVINLLPSMSLENRTTEGSD
jgi:hypothetical protein